MVSGLRLGAEMLGAEAAVELGLPLVAVLPYPEPEARWAAEHQLRFRHLVAAADEVVQLQRKAPESRQQAGAALARRDAWLVRNASEAVLVWDGSDAPLGKLFRSLEDRLDADVWVIDPRELHLMWVGTDTGGTFTDVVTDDGRSGQGAVDARTTPARRCAPASRLGRGGDTARASWPTARRSPPTPCSSGGGRRWPW